MFNAAVDAVQQAVGDLDEGQHVAKAIPPVGCQPCASIGEAKNLYSQLERLAGEAGQPPPPDPFAAEYGEWWDPTCRPGQEELVEMVEGVAALGGAGGREADGHRG